MSEDMKDIVDSMNALSDSVRKEQDKGTLEDRMDVVIKETLSIKQAPKVVKPPFNVNDNITEWFDKYLPLYAALNYKYELKLPKGKRKGIAIVCGQSEMKFDIPEGLDCYNAFVRNAIKEVTVAEQYRLV